MSRAFAVHKARAIVGVEVGPNAPWQLQIEAGGNRVALIVVEEEVTFVGRREVSEAARDAARAFGILVGVGGMNLSTAGDLRRIRGGFPAANARASDGQREKDIGVAENVVIKEISGAGAKVGNVEGPAGQRNG